MATVFALMFSTTAVTAIKTAANTRATINGDDGNSLVSMKNENLGDSAGWVGLRG